MRMAGTILVPTPLQCVCGQALAVESLINAYVLPPAGCLVQLDLLLGHGRAVQIWRDPLQHAPNARPALLFQRGGYRKVPARRAPHAHASTGLK